MLSEDDLPAPELTQFNQPAMPPLGGYFNGWEAVSAAPMAKPVRFPEITSVGGHLATQIKKHQAALSKIVRDDRLTGSRRLLAEVLMLWLEAEGEEKELLKHLLTAVWISPQRTKFTDEGDEPVAEAQGNLEKDTLSHLKKIFASVEEKDAVQSESGGSS